VHKSVASCVAAMSRKGSIGSRSIASTSTISLSTNLNAGNTRLQPCGASSQLVLQAQGSSILCFQHDSLILERRFEGHSEDVVVLSVDNQSDSKLPRVVSIDASRTAIVWDLDNGEEISRYSSYEEIRAVSWMKNGNLTFGNPCSSSVRLDKHIDRRRRLNGKCYTFRPGEVRVDNCKNHIRPFVRGGPFSRLQNICFGVWKKPIQLSA
jgi:WD40 repeat protein